MQRSKEQQGEIRKPSSVINAKKQRKTIEWEDQRTSQDNQRYQGNISWKDGCNKGQKHYGLNRSRRYKKRWQEYTEELYKNDWKRSRKGQFSFTSQRKVMPKNTQTTAQLHSSHTLAK